MQKRNGVSVMLLDMPAHHTKALAQTYYTPMLFRSIGFEINEITIKILHVWFYPFKINFSKLKS